MMTTLELLHSTPKSRQLWYWRQEMESAHRKRNIYPKHSEQWEKWDSEYRNAIMEYNYLSGAHLKPEEY